jgi:acyl carrier protein
MNLSPQGRLKVWLIGAAVLALFVGIAWARVARLKGLVGGDGYQRVASLLVRRFGVPEGRVRPDATLSDLRDWGAERSDFLEALRDELRVSLTEEEAAHIETVQDAAKAAEVRKR